MREIKFRGKREITNKKGIYKGNDLWVYGNLTKHLLSKTVITDLEGKDISSYEYKIQVYGTLNLNKQPKKYTTATYIVDDRTIGQFTGLVDACGDEIYEGDILQDDDNDLWVVEYNEYDAAFVLGGVGVEENFSNLKSTWMTIIGNIYDNPELLEKE